MLFLARIIAQLSTMNQADGVFGAVRYGGLNPPPPVERFKNGADYTKSCGEFNGEKNETPKSIDFGVVYWCD